MMKIDPQGRRYTEHAPGADLDYSVDWSEWLAEGETITESSWAAADGITVSRSQVTDDTVASAFAAGGVAGQQYVLTNTITTTAGRVDSRTITLHCRAR